MPQQFQPTYSCLISISPQQFQPTCSLFICLISKSFLLTDYSLLALCSSVSSVRSTCSLFICLSHQQVFPVDIKAVPCLRRTSVEVFVRCSCLLASYHTCYNARVILIDTRGGCFTDGSSPPVRDRLCMDVPNIYIYI